MDKWIKVKISDLGQVVGGATPSTKKDEYYNGDISWITPKDLSNFKGRYIARGERNITKAGMDSCSTQLLPKNTVLFSSRAPIGYVAIAEKEMCTNQGFKSVIPNEDVDYLFLYYLLKYNKDRIESMGSGTTFKEVSGSTMRNIEVTIPETKATQKIIAAILDAIDSKIENNQKINDNLSEMLQSIYQQRFNISNNGEEHGVLSDICDYSKDRISVSSLSVSNYYSTENMLPGKAGAVDASSLPTIAQTTKCKTGDVLISNIRPYFRKIVYCQSDCGCSTDVLCFTPKSSALSAYLFSTLYADRFFDFMVAGSKGTKMPRGDKQQIMTYAVHIPTDDELDDFNELAKPLLAQIESNRLECISLSALRDGLLPKLMSGEMDVSKVEI